jgi:hypothetical protein
MMMFWLALLGVLLVAMITIDLKARRRHRRLRVEGGDVRRARWDHQAQLGRHAPGGSDHPMGGGF